MYVRRLPALFFLALLAVGCGRSSYLGPRPDAEVPETCGNGVVNVGEQCDLNDLNGQTCQTLGYDSGTLSCTLNCTFNTTDCDTTPPVCGNGVVNVGEQCDINDFAGQTCQTLGFDGGTLACLPECTFDTRNCTMGGVCGNDVLEPANNEQCDGMDLGGMDCVALGFDQGVLACSPSCTYDTTLCEFVTCGNGQLDAGELCDGANLGGESCLSLGWAGGTLACEANCTFDETGCFPDPCGNGAIDFGEDCDGANLGGQSCQSLGFDQGALACAGDCSFDTTGCSFFQCGDSIIDPGEDCDGANLGGETCLTLGFDGGTLGCTAGCVFDTSGCTTAPVCSPTGGSLGCGQVDTDDTAISPDAVDVMETYTGPGCFSQWQMHGPEIVYSYTPTAAEGVTIDMTGLSADLDLIVLEEDGSGCGPQLPCTDWSFSGGPADEQVTFNAVAGQTYYIVVDGFAGAESAYTLNFQCSQPEVCNDGVDNDGDGQVDCADSDCAGDPACDTRQIWEQFPVNTPSDTWDLDGTTLFFLPNATVPDGYTWSVVEGVSGYPSTPGAGTVDSQVISFTSGNDSVLYQLPGAFTYTFFDQTYLELWVNSNGNITFTGGDTNANESATAFTNGLPRIAGHWDNLNPTQAGTVTVDTFVDRVAITFDGVRDPFGGFVSFQIELYFMGAVAITNLTHGTVDGIVGITEGGGSPGSPEVDFYTPPTVQGYYEQFQTNGSDSFDLAGLAITFTPDAADPQGYTYTVNAQASWPFAPGSGNLSTTDITSQFPHGDAAVLVGFTAPHTVSFYNRTDAEVYVGANGYLTFGTADQDWTPSASDHFDLPRISGHFYDWEPDNAGTVTVDEFLTAGGYRFVVTFEDVPHFNNPNPTISFQMSITDAGVVQLYYHDINTIGGLVGISSGGAGVPPAETNFQP